jgi:hypothetical protein
MADAIPVHPQTPKKHAVKKSDPVAAAPAPAHEPAPAEASKAGVKLLSHDAIRIDY